MGRICKKFIISILIIIAIVSIMLNPFQISYAADDGMSAFDIICAPIKAVVGGLVGVFLFIIRAILYAIASGFHLIVSGIIKIGLDETGGTSDFYFITPYNIIFNQIELLNVNFFNFNNVGNTVVGTFRTAVAGWYYTMRLIAAMALSVILVYIGVRMAISTIASEKAMYKKMLVDWMTSLALLFLLHYIMVFVFMINEALVNGMSGIANAIDMDDFMKNLSDVIFSFGNDTLAYVALGIYSAIIFQTITFLLSYFKRMLNIGFLIIIAPLITITYSVDKIGDGKAQALNTWLKEFVYNILLQPFHCILYLSFANTALSLLSTDATDMSNVARGILAILCIQYISLGENLVKKIFGFGQASSLSALDVGAAVALMTNAGKMGKKAGSLAAGTGRLIGKNFSEVKKIANRNAEATKAAKAVLEKNGDKQSDSTYKEKLEKEKEKQKEWLRDKGTVTKDAQEAMADIAKKAAKAQGKENGEKADISGVKSAFSKVGSKFKNVGQKLRESHPYVAGIPLGLARDAGKYFGSNYGKMIQNAVGGLAGTGTFIATGSMGNAVTVAGAMGGIVEGFRSNTTKTLRKDARGYANVLANLTGDGNGEHHVNNTYILGEGGAYKDLSKKLDDIIKKLGKMGVKESDARIAAGQIATAVIKQPESVNIDYINAVVGSLGISSPDDIEKAEGLFENYAKINAEAGLYNALKNAEKAGHDIETMSYVVGNFNPNIGSGQSSNTTDKNTTGSTTTAQNTSTGTNTETHTHTETHTYTEDIKEMYDQRQQNFSGAHMAVMHLLDKFANNPSGVTKADIDATNSKIEELNSNIEQFRHLNDDAKREYVRTVMEEANKKFGNATPVDISSVSPEDVARYEQDITREIEVMKRSVSQHYTEEQFRTEFDNIHFGKRDDK